MIKIFIIVSSIVQLFLIIASYWNQILNRKMIMLLDIIGLQYITIILDMLFNKPLQFRNFIETE